MRILPAALLLVLLASCRGDAPAKYKATSVSEQAAADLLINRNWMDLWPESASEKLHVFRFVPDMGGGVYQDRTLFKGSFELFSFSVADGKIQFHLHHKQQKVSSGFRIERVSGPEPFDLKLSIDSSPRGPSVYYSRSSETSTDLDFALDL